MEENKNWSDIGDEISDVSKKIKEKFDGDGLVDDLKESLHNTISNTSAILKNILANLESTINDEEIKRESKEVLDSISLELRSTIKATQEKLGSLIKNQKLEEE